MADDIRRPDYRHFALALVTLMLSLSALRCSDSGDGAAVTSAAAAPGTPQCGHLSILHSLEVLGVPVDMATVLATMPPRDGGHSLKMLRDAIVKLGLSAEGRRETFDEVRAGSMPVIAHMKDHFVCVIGATGAAVTLFDGEGRRQVWSTQQFLDRWSGAVLRVSRGTKRDPIPATPRAVRKAGVVPRIQFETLYKDLGEIPSGDAQIQLLFGFTNLGDSDLRIADVKVDCSCLKTQYPDQPIKPGAQGEVGLTYTISSEGSFLKTATVFTNDPVTPMIQLSVAGNTHTAVRVEPAKMNLGKIPRGQSLVKQFRVYNDGDQPLQIQGVEFSLPGWDFKFKIQRVEPSGEIGILGSGSSSSDRTATIVELTIGPDTLALGKVDGVVIFATNIPKYAKLEVPVTAEVVSNVAFQPDVLFLGEIPANSDVQKTVLIRTLDHRPFRIVKVEASVDTLKFVYPAEPIDSCQISVHGSIGDPSILNDSPLAVTVQFIDTGDSERVNLPVYGRLK